MNNGPPNNGMQRTVLRATADAERCGVLSRVMTPDTCSVLIIVDHMSFYFLG